MKTHFTINIFCSKTRRPLCHTPIQLISADNKYTVHSRRLFSSHSIVVVFGVVVGISSCAQHNLCVGSCWSGPTWTCRLSIPTNALSFWQQADRSIVLTVDCDCRLYLATERVWHIYETCVCGVCVTHTGDGLIPLWMNPVSDLCVCINCIEYLLIVNVSLADWQYRR